MGINVTVNVISVEVPARVRSSLTRSYGIALPKKHPGSEGERGCSLLAAFRVEAPCQLQ